MLSRGVIFTGLGAVALSMSMVSLWLGWWLGAEAIVMPTPPQAMFTTRPAVMTEASPVTNSQPVSEAQKAQAAFDRQKMRLFSAVQATTLPGDSQLSPIAVRHPFDDAVMPMDMYPPLVLWEDRSSGADTWLVRLRFADGQVYKDVTDGRRCDFIGYRIGQSLADPVRFGLKGNKQVPVSRSLPYGRARSWQCDPAIWRAMVDRAGAGPVSVELVGFDRSDPHRLLSTGQVQWRIDAQACPWPLFYREVGLIFSTAGVKWRIKQLGEKSSRVVMEEVGYCVNCHAVSGNGESFGITLRGAEPADRGYGVVPIDTRMRIRQDDIIAIRHTAGNEKGEYATGRFTSLSPDGRYLLTTVNDEVFFTTDGDRPEIASRFFPTRGILGVYDRKTRRLFTLHGADDPAFVQTNPIFSPDGRTVVFCRAKATEKRAPDEAPSFGSNGEPILQYDLYRIPFNDGRGGKAEPIEGLAGTGKSYSFARFTPDGKWLICVEADNGLLCRPSSRLVIVPAAGGVRRVMTCNQSYVNSWHTISPDGRWMVFAGKGASPWTHLYLTRLYPDGRDSVPMLIDQAVPATRQPNLPEFVNRQDVEIEQLRIPVKYLTRPK